MDFALRIAVLTGLLLSACSGCGEKNNALDPVVCGDVECSADAACTDELCVCKPGFEGDGATCTEIVLACDDDAACGAHGTCGGGFCACDEGYALTTTGCADADECAAGTDDCVEGASCTNTDGGFTCTCPGGTGDDQTCEAFDECAVGADNCDGERAVCIDLDDGFECGCESGYTGDGVTCSVLVDCDADPGACDTNATCSDTPDGTACVCDEGFAGDGTACRQTGFTVLSAEDGTACGLRPDGTMACWGWHVPGADTDELLYGVPRPKATPDGATWKSIDVASGDICGVRTDGTLWCTNRVATAQVGTDTDWARVQSGNNSVSATYCATKTDDTLWCWGKNTHGQVGVGGTTDVVDPTQVGTAAWTDFDVGHGRSCGVQTDGTLWCWGGEGLLGDEIWSEVPRQVGSESDWGSVSIHGFSTIALKQDGRGFGWVYHVPMPESLGAETWRNYVRGDFVDCGVKTDQTLWCKGTNKFGLLGVGGATTTPTFVQIGTESDWTQVVRGHAYCALKEGGDAYCWGRNIRGEPGTGRLPVAFLPTTIAPGISHTSFALSVNHSCAVRSSGELACSGDNLQGGLGRPTTQVYGLVKHEVVDAGPWDSVTVGTAQTCALKAGSLYCFGGANLGQTGTGENMSFLDTPTMVGSDTNWASVEAGGGSTCATKSDGALYCWGVNRDGQLGLGDTERRFVPERVGNDQWASVHLTSGVGEHTCAIKASDQSLWCWGSNGGGQLGQGDTEPALSPVQVGSAAWQSVGTAYEATVAVKADGTLWWWGNLFALQGSNAPVLTPTRIGTDSDWSSVATSNQHACALKDDDSLYCWGQQYGGPTGQPNPENKVLEEPTRVGTSANWTAVYASRQSSCGLQTGGALLCWGLDNLGQLGFGETWYSTPQRVRD